MAGALTKILRLAAARGLLVLLRAAAGAAADACRERRFRVVAAPVPACGLHTVWRRPTRRRFEQALRRRLGLPQAEFRRRAESAAGIDELPPDVPVAATVLLAGARALVDAGVKAFLLGQAAEDALDLARPGEVIAPQPDRVTLLTGLEADADGQACLLELRRRGIACDWLGNSADTALEEVPLREACLRQATPAAGGGLDYAAIAVPQQLTFPRTAMPLPRPLRVLTYRWHVPHQYELFKLGAEFTLVTDLGEGSCRWWDLGQRPLPANARFARWREIDPQQFDLAILHFDEHVPDSPVKDTAVGSHWGRTFRFLREHLTLPCVAVCHGTPQAADAPAGAAGESGNRQALAALLGDTPVVVNSHQAQSEWMFRQSRVIWQGFDPKEFPQRPTPGEGPRRILTLPRDAYALRPAYHGANLLEGVARALPAVRFEQLRVPEPNLLLRGNNYARAKFSHYIATLHGFDIYFNPTLHSPMPRTRGEAMMCGLATVNARSHDVDRFIRNGINGFHGDSVAELADHIGFLLAHPGLAWKIGQASRETAIAAFHIDRFLADWRRLIRDMLGHSAI